MPTFKAPDSTAYGVDKPLDVYLLRGAHDNTSAARSTRGRMGVWCPGSVHQVSSTDTYTVPRICSYGGPAVLPFLYHLAPGVTEITIKIWATVPSNVTSGSTEMTFTAHLEDITRLTRGQYRELGAAQDTDTATQDTSTAVYTLTVDVTNRPRGWTIVLVGFESGESASWTQIDEGTGKGYQVLADWSATRYLISEPEQVTITDTPPFVPCWAVRVEDISTGWDVRLPWARQVLAVYTASYPTANSGDIGIHVHPPMVDQFSFGEQYDSTSDALFYKELGYTDVRSITIYDSAIDDLNDPGASLDGGAAPTPGAIVSQIVAESVTSWGQYTRIHHIGPNHYPTDYDNKFTSGTAAGVVDRITTSLPISSAYQTYAFCLVGDDDNFSQSGTTYRRTALEVAALLCFTKAGVDWARKEFDLYIKLLLSDLDGTNQTSVELDPVAVQCFGIPRQPFVLSSIAPEVSRAALLARYFADNIDYTERSRHALKGVWPESDWLDPNHQWQPLIARLVDDTTSSPRFLFLQAKSSAAQEFNDGESFNSDGPHVTIASWTAISKPIPTERGDTQGQEVTITNLGGVAV